MTEEKALSRTDGDESNNKNEIEKHQAGVIYTDNENLKQFYLTYATLACPTATPDKTEIQRLHILLTFIKKNCKVFRALDNYPWSTSLPLVQKGCGIVLMDPTISVHKRQALNNYLVERTSFISEICELHPLLSHNRLFFDRMLSELCELLHVKITNNDSD